MLDKPQKPQKPEKTKVLTFDFVSLVNSPSNDSVFYHPDAEKWCTDEGPI